MQVPLEDDQIFLHIGELQYVAARQQGKSAAQAYYLPSKVSNNAMPGSLQYAAVEIMIGVH